MKIFKMYKWKPFSNLLVNQIIMGCNSDLFQTQKNSIDLALEKAA